MHLSGIIVPKLNFCPCLVLWWTWPLTYETHNLINSLSYYSSYFQSISISFLHAFQSFFCYWDSCGWTNKDDPQFLSSVPWELDLCPSASTRMVALSAPSASARTHLLLEGFPLLPVAILHHCPQLLSPCKAAMLSGLNARSVGLLVLCATGYWQVVELSMSDAELSWCLIPPTVTSVTYQLCRALSQDKPGLGGPGRPQSQVLLQSSSILIYSCTHAVNVQVMDQTQ